MSGRKILSMLLAAAILFTVTPVTGLAAALTLPPAVKTIGEAAFENDTSLGEVVLPEGIVSIGSRAFAGTRISRIVLPDSLTDIAEDAFEDARVGVFEAERNSAAWQWLEDHSCLLHFGDESMYDVSVDMAIFQSDPAKGLGDDWCAAWYELAEYADRKETAKGEPAWTATQTSGPEAEFQLQSIGGQASLSVAMPDSPAVYTFTLSCSWEGRSVSTGATVRYLYPDSLPTGTDIPDRIELTMDQENVLPFHFTPADYSFGQSDRVGFEHYTGSADAWYDGHDLHIIPHDPGTFTGEVFLYAGNLYIAKEVTFEVRPIPEQILERTNGLLDEDSGRINLDALTPVSADAVTDPYALEKIAAFNDALPQLRADAETYNQAMDELDALTAEMAEKLGDVTVEGTSERFSLTSDLFSFSCGEGVQEALEGDSEIVSAEVTDDAALLTLSKDGKTSTLRITAAGISLVYGASERSGADGSGAAAAAGKITENALGFLAAVDETLLWFSQFDTIQDAAVAAWEGIGAFSEGAAPYVNQLNRELGGKLMGALRLFGIEEDCRHISSGAVHIQEILQQFNHILAVIGHGHPTDMEAADAVMMSTVTMLQPQIKIARASYAADVFMTLGDMALNISHLIENTVNFKKEWKNDWDPDGISFAEKSLDVVKDIVVEWVQQRFQRDYKKMCELDDELHYDFSGIVFDEDMKPLQGVQVILGSNTVYTDAMGMYEMESAYSLAAPIFQRKGYKDRGAPHSIKLKPNEKGTLSVQMFWDQDGGRIEGRVIDENTHEPVSWAIVSYQGQAVMPDKDGYYSIDAPYQKADTLTVKADGYAPWSIPVAAPEAGGVHRIDAPLRPIGKWTITGTVYGKTYDQAKQDWVVRPLSGVTVVWGDGKATATTGADGTYEIGSDEETLAELSTLTFSHEPLYQPVTLNTPALRSDIMYEDFDCTLQVRYGSIQVIAVPEHSGEANAFVSATGISDGIRVKIGDLAEDLPKGTYRYIPVGTYTVTADGAAVNLGSATETVTVEEGKTASVEMILPWKTGVRGTVLDEDGTPYANADIWVYAFTREPERAGKTQCRTDESGKFYLFSSDSDKGGELVLSGEFVSMDYQARNKLQFTPEKGKLNDVTYQVRRTEGKYVREITFGVDLASGETLTKGLTLDVTWGGRSVHLEEESALCPKLYLVAESEDTNVTVSASIGINGKLYSRSLTENITEIQGRLGFGVSGDNNKDWN